MSRQKKVFALVVGILVAANALFVTCKQPTSSGGTAPSATSIMLDDRNGLTMYVGDTANLYYTLTPSNASTSVTWDSSDLDVIARVDKFEKDKYGKITALKAGTTTLTVKTASGRTDTCTVTVLPAVPLQAIALNTTTLFLIVGEEATLLSMPIPPNAKDKEVNWESSDNAVAAVENGVVKALKASETKITITATSTFDTTKFASCEVTVAAERGSGVVPVESVSLDKDELSFTNGEINTTLSLAAEFKPLNPTNKKINWYSNNTEVATVTPSTTNVQNGTVSVKAIAPGSAIIIATTEDGGYFTLCPVTVAGPPDVNPTPGITSVTGVRLNITNLNLDTDKNQDAALVATVIPFEASDKQVLWNSTNPGVATVSANGAVKAIAAGTALITVTTVDNNRIAFCTVTVSAPKPVPVTGVTLNTDTLTLTLGGTTTTLVPLVQPPDASNKSVSWASSDSSVVSVDQDGVVTARKVSTAPITITVTTQDGGHKATCEVEVKSSSPGTVSVTGVKLNINELNLRNSGTATLTATVIPADATNQDVSWMSSNTNLATVSGNGTVIMAGTGTGTVSIIVTTADGGKTDVCNITIPGAVARPVTGVELSTNKLEFKLGSANVSSELKALVLPADATNQEVSWASSNSAVATVVNGMVTAAGKDGTATITVTTRDGGHKKTCEVTVYPADSQNVAVTGVTLNIEAVTLKPGATATLLASVTPEDATNQEVSWASTNNAVATVSSSGLVTAIGPATGAGTAAIIATTVDGGKIAQCTITVQGASTVPVTGVELDKNSLALEVGQSAELKATLTPTIPTNPTMVWTSSNRAIADVVSGTVYALGPGSANITVTTQDGGYKDTCLVEVTGEKVPITGVELRATLTLAVGATATLTATVQPPNANQIVTWSTTDISIANVNKDGEVSAGTTSGTATITATAMGDTTKKAECVVTVESDVQEVRTVWVPNVLTLDLGESVTLTRIVLPPDAFDQRLSWVSSEPTIVYVNQSGTVEARGYGKETITVRSVANPAISAICEVTVPEPDPTVIAVSSVSLDSPVLVLKKDEREVLTATVLPEDATNKAVQWSSTDPTVATVDSDGIITAVEGGTAIIYVTTVNMGKWATCAVAVSSASGSITVEPAKVEIIIGESPVQLTATVLPSSASQNVTWKSLDETVATVSTSGLVSAVAAGITVITATTVDGSSLIAQCQVKVEDPEPEYLPVESIIVVTNKISLKNNKDNTTTLDYTILPAKATNKDVKIKNFNSAFLSVSVDANNIIFVTPQRTGTSNVTIYSDDNPAVECTWEITVTQSTDYFIGYEQLKDAGNTLNISGGLILYRKTATDTPNTTPLVLTLSNSTQYSVMNWYVNATAITANGATLSLVASQFDVYSLGYYTIALEVQIKDSGEWALKEITFELKDKE